MCNVDHFLKHLKDATGNMTEQYFFRNQCSTGSSDETPDNPATERIYAYEFYFQLKTVMVTCGLCKDRYTINGEPSKSKHPVYTKNAILNNKSPDIIIHHAIDMSDNLAVIEIKPINKACGVELGHDIDKLVNFVKPVKDDGGNYAIGIFLTYGDGTSLINRKDDLERKFKNLDIQWWHQLPGQKAERMMSKENG